MSSVEILPIMHLFVHPKIVQDSSHMTALDTDSFDIPSQTHELRDSRKVVAVSRAVPADLSFTNARSYTDSSRFGWF